MQDITIPDLKLYYEAIVTKTAWYLHKKQTCRPMGKYIGHRHKFVQLQPFDSGQKAKNVCWIKYIRNNTLKAVYVLLKLKLGPLDPVQNSIQNGSKIQA